MKKSIVIFFVFTYAFSITGFALKASYCCEKLQFLKLILAQGGKDKAGCCKTKYQYFKVTDSHAAADVVDLPGPTSAILPSFLFPFELNNAEREACPVSINIHAPPPRKAPSYIYNCIFRI